MASSIVNELKPFEDLAFSFAQKELAGNQEENDRYPFSPFFQDVLDRAYEVGFPWITLPESLGGVEGGIRTSALAVILDNVSRIDASLGGILFTNAMALELLLSAGSEKILERIVTGTDTGGKPLFAFPSFNNPSEIEHLALVKKENQGYLLSGDIEYIVLGGIAQHAIIPARISGQDNYSFFLVDLSDNGLSKSEPVLSLGLHACPAVDLKLNNVKGELVGKEGKGAIYFNESADKMHAPAAAIASGILKGSFEEALAYTQERFQGGKVIIQWSEIKSILARMAVNVKIAEMTTAQASMAVDNKEPGWELCSRAAALHIQEIACDATTDGIQLLGGYGYMKDYGQEKRFRDAKQVQSLLGLTPMKRIKYLERIIEK